MRVLLSFWMGVWGLTTLAMASIAVHDTELIELDEEETFRIVGRLNFDDPS